MAPHPFVHAALALALALALASACGGGSSGSVAAEKGNQREEDAPSGDETTPAAEQAGSPDFRLSDLDGNELRLADLRGSIVVLEWFNPDCPFVAHAHSRRGPLRRMAAGWKARGVVWLAINSGAPGKQGTGREHNREMAANFGIRHPVLLDETGEVGRLYGAERTPHLVVIDARGSIAYAGAIDNAPRGNVRGGGEREAYVEAALEALTAGEAVDRPATASYGCTIKYADSD